MFAVRFFSILFCYIFLFVNFSFCGASSPYIDSQDDKESSDKYNIVYYKSVPKDALESSPIDRLSSYQCGGMFDLIFSDNYRLDPPKKKYECIFYYITSGCYMARVSADDKSVFFDKCKVLFSLCNERLSENFFKKKYLHSYFDLNARKWVGPIKLDGTDIALYPLKFEAKNSLCTFDGAYLASKYQKLYRKCMNDEEFEDESSSCDESDLCLDYTTDSEDDSSSGESYQTDESEEESEDASCSTSYPSDFSTTSAKDSHSNSLTASDAGGSTRSTKQSPNHTPLSKHSVKIEQSCLYEKGVCPAVNHENRDIKPWPNETGIWLSGEHK